MIAVVWNAYGFHVIQSLSKGIKWAGRYYSDNIFFFDCCSSGCRQSSKNDHPCR
jgi:hypothetical protein